MTRFILPTAAALAISAGAAAAQTTSFTAVISSGPQQATPSGSPAMGTLDGVYDASTNSFAFSWDISDDLLGVPASPGSHLHRAPSGVNGPIVFAFNEPDGTWALSGEATWTGISTSDVEALFAGNIYVNFHTTEFPGGEVRGQVTIVPAPGATAAAALMGMGMMRRRRR